MITVERRVSHDGLSWWAVSFDDGMRLVLDAGGSQYAARLLGEHSLTGWARKEWEKVKREVEDALLVHRHGGRPVYGTRVLKDWRDPPTEEWPEPTQSAVRLDGVTCHHLAAATDSDNATGTA